MDRAGRQSDVGVTASGTTYHFEVRGTFWYDFFTGPALGGLGALAAAILIAAVTVKVSSDRRDDAMKDRTAERERTRREEWFRRLQWGQGLTSSEDVDTQDAGFKVLIFLATSELAAADDLELLDNLLATTELQERERSDDEIVDETDYVVDTQDEDDDQVEEGV